MKLYTIKVTKFLNSVWIEKYGNPTGMFCYEHNVGGAYGGGMFLYSPFLKEAAIYYSKKQALKAIKKYGTKAKGCKLELIEFVSV